MQRAQILCSVERLPQCLAFVYPFTPSIELAQLTFRKRESVLSGVVHQSHDSNNGI